MIPRKTKTQARKFIKKAIAVAPLVAYMRSRRRARLMPFVLGAIGVAAFGGAAAVMLLSPRSRTRALEAARDAYDRVADQLDTMGLGDKLGIRARREARLANGLVSEGIDYSVTSGL
ncbi:hypothetical protein [Labilithrix luteola]|nr:hypothetical protein [Labilithrix luteola]